MTARLPPLLPQFAAACARWHRYRRGRGHCWPARQAVYKALVARHGADAVLRHVGQIRAILDRAQGIESDWHVAMGRGDSAMHDQEEIAA